MNKPVVKTDPSVGIFEDFFHIKLLPSQSLIDSLASDPSTVRALVTDGPADKAKWFRENFGTIKKDSEPHYDPNAFIDKLKTDYGVRAPLQWYGSFLPVQDMKTEFKAMAAGERKLPDFVLKKIEEIRQLPTELAKLQAIKHFVDGHISGGDDKPKPGRMEQFQTLSESMKSHKGDCDDYAAAYAGMAREVGISPSHIITVGGKLAYSFNHDSKQYADGSHMITVVNIGDEMFAMDNTRSKVVPMDHDFSYKGDAVWQAKFTFDTKVTYEQTHIMPTVFFNENELYAVSDRFSLGVDQLDASPTTFLAGNRPVVPK